MGHHFTELTLRDRLIARKMGADPLKYKVANYKGKAHSGWRLSENHIKPLQSYVDFVWSLVMAGGILYVETRVNYSQPLGVDRNDPEMDAFGTADALIVMPDGVLWVIDLKFGKWDVDAERNTQQGLYAIGGYRNLRLLHDIKGFNFVIFQPRTKGRPDDQWRATFEWLDKVIDKAYAAAGTIIELLDITDRGLPIPAKYFKPSKENCEFCRKADCDARRKTWGR